LLPFTIKMVNSTIHSSSPVMYPILCAGFHPGAFEGGSREGNNTNEHELLVTPFAMINNLLCLWPEISCLASIHHSGRLSC
jgi:hypothetical protein